jgi:hypothetical protein
LAPYTAVTSASTAATASGPEAESSVGYSTINQLPFPAFSVLTNTVEYSVSVLGTTVAFRSDVSVGGAAIGWLNVGLGH